MFKKLAMLKVATLRKKALAVALIAMFIAVPVVIAEGPYLHDEDVSITGYLEIAGDTILGSDSVSPDGTTHVYSASAGAVSPQSYADDFVVENSGGGGISILVPDSVASNILAGFPNDNDYHGFQFYGSTHGTYAGEVHWKIGGATRAHLTSGEIEFQQAETLSTTMGDFTIAPADGDTNITGNVDVSGDLTVDGIKIGSDLDEDIQLLKVEVTGNPSLWWDESEDEFELDRGIDITGSAYISGDLTVDGTIYGELGEFFYLTEELDETYIAKLEARILSLEARVLELEAQLTKILQYID